MTDAEREAGVKLIADYRASESTVLSNDIESRQHALTRLKGIPLELMKREIAACDFDKWTQAQAEVDRLRKEALELAETIFKRLIKSLDDQINETAIAAEQRLIDAGLPLRNGDSWLLHDDSLCRALWSQGRIADRTLAELTPDNAVGCIQWFCSGEPDVPFQWSALSYRDPALAPFGGGVISVRP